MIRGGKPTAMWAFMLGALFCVGNGYMQARGSLLLSTYDMSDETTLFRVGCGISLFSIGMLMNLHSDHVLRNLRKPGETGYKIPKGLLFTDKPNKQAFLALKASFFLRKRELKKQQQQN